MWHTVLDTLIGLVNVGRIKGQIQVPPHAWTPAPAVSRNSSSEMLGAARPLLVPLTTKMARGDYSGRRAEDAGGLSKAG